MRIVEPVTSVGDAGGARPECSLADAEPSGGPACVDLPASRTVAPTSRRCAACAAAGREWVSLRVCLTCGHVGCCDNTVGRHATAHHEESGHPVITSGEPGERWQWCFVHGQSWRP